MLTNIINVDSYLQNFVTVDSLRILFLTNNYIHKSIYNCTFFKHLQYLDNDVIFYINGNINVVRLLLNKPTYKIKHLYIYLSAFFGYKDIVNLILKYSTFLEKYSYTDYEIAQIKGNETVNLIYYYLNYDLLDQILINDIFNTILFFAISGGHIDIVDCLVKIHKYSSDVYTTALIFTYVTQNCLLVERLIDSGGDITTHCVMLINHACMTNNIEFVKYLHTKKIRSNLAMTAAASVGSLDMIKYLQSENYDIRYCSHYAWRKAAEYGHVNVLQYLNNYGYNTEYYYDIALRHAVIGDNTDTFLYINKLSININYDLHFYWAKEFNKQNVIKCLNTLPNRYVGMLRNINRFIHKYYTPICITYFVASMFLLYYKI